MTSLDVVGVLDSAGTVDRLGVESSVEPGVDAAAVADAVEVGSGVAASLHR